MFTKKPCTASSSHSSSEPVGDDASEGEVAMMSKTTVALLVAQAEARPLSEEDSGRSRP